MGNILSAATEIQNNDSINENDLVNNMINMREAFVRRLDTLGHNGNEICDLLIPDHTVIAGSFAIQVLTNNFFTDKKTDVDIFTYDDKKLNDYFLTKGYSMVDEATKKYGTGSKGEKIPYKYKIGKISKVISYDIPESATPIQIILMEKSDSMNQCIENNFDLDFCKIIFDGQNIIRYDNGSLDTKQCIFSMSKNNLNETQLYATWHRIKKYTARGYGVIVTK